MEFLIVTLAGWLGFNNGANDNFKGFATTWGTQTLSYRQSIIWATLATVAGSLMSMYLANSLLHAFSGAGLVPDALLTTPAFMASVSGGAAITIFVATRWGLPVSTTHALLGALLGAGLTQGFQGIHVQPLLHGFVAPLLISPFVAAMLSMGIVRGFKSSKTLTSAAQEDCLCIRPESRLEVSADGIATYRQNLQPEFIVASQAACAQDQLPLRLNQQTIRDRLHVGSALAICFARGVNDTPKLAALMVAGKILSIPMATLTISVLMGLGGIVFARRVAETMSLRVSKLQPEQGLIANLVTAGLVLFASRLGMPVSTTHVAVGSIAGAGAGANSLNRTTLRNILLSWIATLPLAALLTAATLSLLHTVR